MQRYVVPKNAVKPRAIDHTEVENFDRDQKATMIDQTAGHDRFFGCLWPRESDNASLLKKFAIFCGS